MFILHPFNIFIFFGLPNVFQCTTLGGDTPVLTSIHQVYVLFWGAY